MRGALHGPHKRDGAGTQQWGEVENQDEVLKQERNTVPTKQQWRTFQVRLDDSKLSSLLRAQSPHYGTHGCEVGKETGRNTEQTHFSGPQSSWQPRREKVPF